MVRRGSRVRVSFRASARRLLLVEVDVDAGVGGDDDVWGLVGIQIAGGDPFGDGGAGIDPAGLQREGSIPVRSQEIEAALTGRASPDRQIVEPIAVESAAAIPLGAPGLELGLVTGRVQPTSALAST